MSLPLRRMSREWALQLLYQLDLGSDEPDDAVFAAFWQQLRDSGTKLRDKEWTRTTTWAEALVRGVRQEYEFIDGLIAGYAQHWNFDRILAIDRNIMRLAVYEMYFCEDIPPAVSINEAIELAKAFGDPESSAFVNGILDRIHKSRETV
jgi:N utilization substance protein B